MSAGAWSRTAPYKRCALAPFAMSTAFKLVYEFDLKIDLNKFDLPTHVLTEACVQQKLVYDHIQKLRALPTLKNCTVVLGVESNLGFEAQHMLHALRRMELHNLIPLYEGVDSTVGLLTTNKTKEVMCTALQELLSSNRLQTFTQFMSISVGPIEMIKRLTEELRSFMIYVDQPRSLVSRSRRTYTGKMGGHQDDAAMALQMSILCMQCFTRHSKYANVRSV